MQFHVILWKIKMIASAFIKKCFFSVTIVFVAVFFVSLCYAGDVATKSQSSKKSVGANQYPTKPVNESAFDKREQDVKNIFDHPFAIAFYKPNYVLPFYYTNSPYRQVYENNTPYNQTIQSEEFKAQFSFQIPLWYNFLGENSRLSIAYTQLMYWQVYAKSKYFRETNYQPEIFVVKKITPNFWMNLGLEHQSNGRGGAMERSWNRAYVNAIFSKGDFVVSLRPWIIVFNGPRNLYNPDIDRYMGHGEIMFSYQWRGIDFSLKTRNNFESLFKRGGNELNCSFPLLKKVKLFVQVFSGYGQSLIEYNHYTNSFGVGIALSDWI